MTSSPQSLLVRPATGTHRSSCSQEETSDKILVEEDQVREHWFSY